MGSTKIEWATETWNPITGCSKISPGCANCYAERMAKRLAGRFGYPKDDPFAITLHEQQLKKPYKWRKPRMIFVCSMGDLFHEDVPFEWINLVISKAASAHRKNPNHKWLFLTKRPERVQAFREWILKSGEDVQPFAWFTHMAWLGVTAENQEQADRRIPTLLQIPAAMRFVSVEPMLGPVDLRLLRKEPCDHKGCLRHFTHPCEGCGYQAGRLPIDWVICGGESGPGARPMHPEWTRGLRDQCEAAGVPFFFKQWGEWGTSNYHLVSLDPVFRQFYSFTQWMDKATTWVNGGRCIDIDGSDLKRGIDFKEANYPVAIMHRVGKKKAGRVLDGRTWDQYPQ